jgi:ribonuclease PH
MSTRLDGRRWDQLREVTIERGTAIYAEGSALIKSGNTQILCTATVSKGVPIFLRDSGQGWITAEYAMLPRATGMRTKRERRGAGGRTMEIQRLVGRSLRSVVDLTQLGDRTITVDCDVLLADGGTRTAAITGAFVALSDSINNLVADGQIARNPIKEHVAAISVGILKGKAALDLCYEEDSSAEVDMNIVMTGSGKFVEIQGTAEREPFSWEKMNDLIRLAETGIGKLLETQRAVLAQ